MGVSKNSGTPKSSILIGFSIAKPSILGYPYHPYLLVPITYPKLIQISRGCPGHAPAPKSASGGPQGFFWNLGTPENQMEKNKHV